METLEDKVGEMFEECDGDFLHFEELSPERKKFSSPDMCAMALLESYGLLGPQDAIGWAEHDVAGLNVEITKLAEVADIEFIRDLCRCGVIYFSEYDSIGFYV